MAEARALERHKAFHQMKEGVFGDDTSNDIVAKHNCKIQVESEIGRGCNFTITLLTDLEKQLNRLTRS